MTRYLPSRRAVLTGTGGLLVVAGAGGVWRAADRGVFEVGEGPAYAPWHDWRTAELDGPLALVRAGLLAASAHNTQPWRFRVDARRIAVHADADRHLGAFDPYRREMVLSLGCAVENMVQAGRAMGYAPRVEAAPGRLDPGAPDLAVGPVAVVHLDPGDGASGPDLAAAIPERHTHRGAYEPDTPVSAELKAEMRDAVAPAESHRLMLFDRHADGDGAAADRLGELLVAATEEIVADRAMAADSAAWFRFDPASIRRHRDGVTLDTVGLPPLMNAVAKMLPPPSAEGADRIWLERTRDVHVATAPLFGMIAVRDLYDVPATLAAGRAWQRAHLWATARGLAAQPLNMPPERVDREAQLGRPPSMARRLAAVTGAPDWRPTFVFRLGRAGRAARLSPRRPVSAVAARA